MDRQCLKCKSGNVIAGQLGNRTHYVSFAPLVFKPDRKLRFLAWIFSKGTRCYGEAFACLHCGLVWSYLSTEELKDFI
jgi:cytochrome P450